MRLRVLFNGNKATVRCFANDRRDSNCYSTAVIDMKRDGGRKARAETAIEFVRDEARYKMGVQLGLQGLRNPREGVSDA